MSTVYGCFGCGGYFKFELLSGKAPKVSPCCGDSVFSEVTSELLKKTSDKELVKFASHEM